MTIQFNRIIGYTHSWKSTFLIGIIVSAVFCFVLIFLQPFDTYSTELTYKNAKLAGYAIPIMLSILGIHILENSWFQKSSQWTLLNEIVFMTLGTIVVTVLSFIYLNSIVNPTALPWSEFFPWFRVFGLPFAPIFLLLWGYLRFRFGKIELSTSSTTKIKTVRIEGTNAHESLELNWSDFILAKSQSNYIEIFYFNQEKNEISKAIIRSTLAKVLDQLSDATQTHRSYIINLDHLIKLEGNMRKGWCYLKGIEETVPVSPKHFKAIKTRLQKHP